METNTKSLLTGELGIDPKVLDVIAKAESEITDQFAELDDIAAFNQYKVLSAFQKNKISDKHFNWSTGYGYDDAGR